jgi:hypothetical protein
MTVNVSELWIWNDVEGIHRDLLQLFVHLSWMIEVKKDISSSIYDSTHAWRDNVFF